jgi:hypothetical protein
MSSKVPFFVAVAAFGLAVPSVSAQGRYQGKGDCLNVICTAGAVVTEQEEEHVVYMREEEKLARDVYLAMYDLWGLRIFANISESEQRHMDALGRLIECYDLEDPITDNTPGQFTNPVFTQLYEDLVHQGSGSALDGLMVGALIEELDIVDLRAALSETENPDLQTVFENLMRGSRNHLRSFFKLITKAGGTYEPQYLSPAEFDEIVSSPMERRNGRRTASQRGKNSIRSSSGYGGFGNGDRQRLRDGSCQP